MAAGLFVIVVFGTVSPTARDAGDEAWSLTGQQWTMDSSTARGKDNTLAGETPISTHLRRRLLQ